MDIIRSSLLKIVGILTLVEGLFMMPCVLTAIYFDEYDSAKGLFFTSLFAITLGAVLVIIVRFDKVKLSTRSSYFIACMSWVYCSFIGAFPIYLSSLDISFTTAFFEAVAGFSTTGCTVLNYSLMPKCILMWRAISHWMGGMGILVLLITIFPLWGINNQSLASAEASGANTDKLGAKYSDMGKFLYACYLALTAIEYLLLVIGPMDWYNAILTALSSISTAGLIITDEYASLYSLAYVKIIVMTFTILSSMNYVAYFLILKGRWKDLFRNTEIRIYLSIIATSTILVMFALRFLGTYKSLWQAAKDSVYTVVSFISTSGYPTINFDHFPQFAITLLFLLMFIGGCSFSTSGSLKVIRVAIMFKLIKRGMMLQIHPNMVKAIILNKKPVSAKSAASVTMHILLFFGVFVLGCILLSFNNLGLETTISTCLGIFTNTGLGIGEGASYGYFGMFNEFSRFIMSILMIAGRLEIYSVIILFAKSFWKPDNATVI